MNKSIKVILAGILAVPMLALGISVVSTSVVFAVECDPTSIASGANCAKSDEQPSLLFGDGSIFSVITNTALFLIGAVSVLMLIYGGIRYTLSAGDSAAVTAAKNTILYAIIGIIVALLAFAIVNFVISRLVVA
jgi:lysylphosphatidylglycerol synthetase-like protein (DUF2156 family)